MLLGTWNLRTCTAPAARPAQGQGRLRTKLASLAAVITELDRRCSASRRSGTRRRSTTWPGCWTASGTPPPPRIRTPGHPGRLPQAVRSRGSSADTNAFPAHVRPVQVRRLGRRGTDRGPGFPAVEVTTGTGPLTVAVAHLKSKLLTYPGNRFFPHDEGERARYGAYALYRRAAERRLAALADDLLAGEGVPGRGLLGDHETTRCRPRPPRSCSAPPGSEIATPGYDRADQATRSACGTWPADPRRPALLRINSGRRELIDHILLSHHLVHRVTGGDGTAGEERCGCRRWARIPAERREAPGSDHAPVWVRVEVTHGWRVAPVRPELAITARISSMARSPTPPALARTPPAAR